MSLFRLYLVSPLFVGLIVALLIKNDSVKRKTYSVLYGIITFLFFALRSPQLGSGDSQFYFNLWEQFSGMSFTWNSYLKAISIDLERGFLTLVWFLSHIFNNGQYFFVFAGLFIAFGIGMFIYEHCEDYVLAALVINGLGMTGFMLQGTRQAIAISLCLLSYRYCKNRKIIPFVLLIVCASLVHASALIFLIAYFIYGVKLDWKSAGLVMVCLVMYRWILDTITTMANYFMNEHYTGGNTELTSGGWITLFTLIALIMYCILVNNPVYCNTDSELYVDYSSGFFMMMICTFLFSLRFFYISDFDRACYYFLPFISIAIESTYFRYTIRSRRLIRVAFYVFFVVWTLYKSVGSSPLSAYEFFWVLH